MISSYTDISKDGVLFRDTEFLEAGTRIFSTEAPVKLKICDKNNRTTNPEYKKEQMRIMRAEIKKDPYLSLINKFKSKSQRCKKEGRPEIHFDALRIILERPETSFREFMEVFKINGPSASVLRYYAVDTVKTFGAEMCWKVLGYFSELKS